jgi:hypothetical protein
VSALTADERHVIQLALENYLHEIARKQKAAIRRGDENEVDRLTELGDLAAIAKRKVIAMGHVYIGRPTPGTKR